MRRRTRRRTKMKLRRWTKMNKCSKTRRKIRRTTKMKTRRWEKAKAIAGG